MTTLHDNEIVRFFLEQKHGGMKHPLFRSVGTLKSTLDVDISRLDQILASPTDCKFDAADEEETRSFEKLIWKEMEGITDDKRRSTINSFREIVQKYQEIVAQREPVIEQSTEPRNSTGILRLIYPPQKPPVLPPIKEKKERRVRTLLKMHFDPPIPAPPRQKKGSYLKSDTSMLIAKETMKPVQAQQEEHVSIKTVIQNLRKAAQEVEQLRKKGKIDAKSTEAKLAKKVSEAINPEKGGKAPKGVDEVEHQLNILATGAAKEWLMSSYEVLYRAGFKDEHVNLLDDPKVKQHMKVRFSDEEPFTESGALRNTQQLGFTKKLVMEMANNPRKQTAKNPAVRLAVGLLTLIK